MKGFFQTLKEKLFGNYERVVDFTEYIRKKDAEKTRIASAFGYLLFFVPLIWHDDSQFARFHTNQSLINLILSTIGAVILGFVPYAGMFLVMIQELLCVIWAIRGIYYALNRKAVGIPFVGWITIVPYRYPGQ